MKLIKIFCPCCGKEIYIKKVDGKYTADFSFCINNKKDFKQIRFEFGDLKPEEKHGE